MCDTDCVEKLLTDLNVLGKIGTGFKINTKDKFLKLDDTKWWQGALRWYRGDSRDTMYEKVHTTVNNSLRFLNLAITDLKKTNNSTVSVYMNSTPENFLRILFDILKKTKVGWIGGVLNPVEAQLPTDAHKKIEGPRMNYFSSARKRRAVDSMW